VFIKIESIQPSGSFKSRGVGYLIRQAILRAPQGAPLHFYSSSGGNAGLACVTAAQMLGYPATVVVPMTTKPSMIAKIRAAGATEVIQIGDSWLEADTYLREDILEQDSSGVYVPPFDHPDIWAGNATLAGEIKKQMPDGDQPDAVVTCVGGGGLLAGLAQGLEECYARPPYLLAIETVGCESLYQSAKAGRLITLDRITSLATSLGARRVAEKAFEYAQKPYVKPMTVTDADAAEACWRFADDERILVELACGAAISPVYTGMLRKALPHMTAESKVVVIVCGGANVSMQQLVEYRDMFHLEERGCMANTDVRNVHMASEGHN